MTKPLDLIVSAIQCLEKKNGCSLYDILKFLEVKYDANPKKLKKYIKAGLKRGLCFGLLLQNSGLYRLNDILNSPLHEPKVNKMHKTQRIKKKAVVGRSMGKRRGKEVHKSGRNGAKNKAQKRKKLVVTEKELHRKRSVRKLRTRKQKWQKDRDLVKGDSPSLLPEGESAGKSLADLAKPLKVVSTS